MTFDLFFWALGGIAVGIVFASFFEWVLHKYVMHRPVGKFRYAFHAHAVVHHQIFKADHTYHLINEKDKDTIPMAWWNGPVLIAIGILPFAALSWLFGQWAFAVGGLIAFTSYYGFYEYIHWCMHLPKARRIEKPWFFQRLDAHHRLHHRYMHKNFNVVLPLADLCLGTLRKRAIERPVPANTDGRGSAAPLP